MTTLIEICESSRFPLMVGTDFLSAQCMTSNNPKMMKEFEKLIF